MTDARLSDPDMFCVVFLACWIFGCGALATYGIFHNSLLWVLLGTGAFLGGFCGTILKTMRAAVPPVPEEDAFD
jgi:hypothetical protein